MSDREQARALMERLRSEAQAGGYSLNPDEELVLDLMDGLLANEARYGYPACPCRLADGMRQRDRDMICPCDYRDPDLDEFGTCYCGLYVSQAVADGRQKVGSIPERRPPGGPAALPTSGTPRALASGSLPVWRCQVCGYLCARPQPPLKCPICKVDKDRFERFS